MLERAERIVLQQEDVLSPRGAAKQVHRTARDALDAGHECDRVERGRVRPGPVSHAVRYVIDDEPPIPKMTDEHG